MSLRLLLIPVIYISVLCNSTNATTNVDACSDGRSVGFLVWNVSIVSQLDLDQFIQNVSAYNYSDQKKTVTTNCLYLSLTAGDYELDIIKLMKISTNGSLMITGKSEGGSVGINCKADGLVGTEDLQPLSRALLVLLDGLIFTGCPVPILIEEAFSVVIQNCVFQ